MVLFSNEHMIYTLGHTVQIIYTYLSVHPHQSSNKNHKNYFKIVFNFRWLIGVSDYCKGTSDWLLWAGWFWENLVRLIGWKLFDANRKQVILKPMVSRPGNHKPLSSRVLFDQSGPKYASFLMRGYVSTGDRPGLVHESLIQASNSKNHELNTPANNVSSDLTPNPEKILYPEKYKEKITPYKELFHLLYQVWPLEIDYGFFGSILHGKT